VKTDLVVLEESLLGKHSFIYLFMYRKDRWWLLVIIVNNNIKHNNGHCYFFIWINIKYHPTKLTTVKNNTIMQTKYSQKALSSETLIYFVSGFIYFLRHTNFHKKIYYRLLSRIQLVQIIQIVVNFLGNHQLQRSNKIKLLSRLNNKL
jgi:hypothetical protein